MERGYNSLSIKYPYFPRCVLFGFVRARGRLVANATILLHATTLITR